MTNDYVTAPGENSVTSALGKGERKSWNQNRVIEHIWFWSQLGIEFTSVTATV